jgi:chromosome segregation ATPase
VVSLARQVGESLKASEQQRKRVEELETLLRSAAGEKTRLAAAMESAARERSQMQGEAQRLQAELVTAQKTAQAGASEGHALVDAERREVERLQRHCDELRAEVKTVERLRENERAEREQMQRELEMERRERDMNVSRGADEAERVQSLECDKSTLERSLRQLELRRRDWAEKELKWESERSDLLESQRLMEQELSQLRATRDQHQHTLASTEERAQTQVLSSPPLARPPTTALTTNAFSLN